MNVGINIATVFDADSTKVDFVLDLCARRDHMLEKWVREIFDKDGKDLFCEC